MNKETKSDMMEMLIAKNCLFIALGFAIVGILGLAGVDFMVSVIIVCVLIALNNQLHCKRYWSEVFSK